MMIATARATSGSSGSRAGRTWRSVRILVRRDTAIGGPSDLHDLRFFVLQQVVDRLRVLVGQLLHALLGAPLVVVADLVVLRQVLQMLHHVTADIPNRDLAFLRELADDLGELLSPLLVRLRHR